MEKKWFQSSNFWMAITLCIGGLWIGFPEGEARNVVGSVFGLFASGGALRQFFKYAQTDWKLWLKSVNTWNYLAAALTAVIPTIPGDLFPALRGLFEAAMGGNWQGIVTAVFSLGTILYYWLRPKAVV